MSADAAASGTGTTEATSTATATDDKVTRGKPISIFSIVMLTMAAVLSLRNFPTMATYGWSSITWYVLGTVLFMVPISLIGAELATGPWRQEGGVFAWVRAGVGDRPGMIAVWCEWTENIVWFPTVLSFLAASLFYAFNPDLANNNVAMFVVMLGTFWAVTLLNFKGVQASSVLNNVGTMLGSILPAIVLVVAMVIFLLQGNSSEIPFSGSALVPDFSVGNLPFVATVVLIFAGMEMGGYQADKMENPQRDFPKAIFVSALFIVAATVLATIAIAIVVPTRDISLAAGLMQAFDSFFDQLNASWLTPVMAVLVVLGSAAQLNSWLLGPAQGLSVVRTGDLPPMFLRQNRNGAPVSVLLLQGALGTLFSCLFLFMPGVNSSYWILSALTTEIFCVMYTLIFISAIKLRYSKPVEQFPRSYTVPGGMLGMWLIGGVGLVAIVFTFVVGLIPSDQLKSGNTAVYVVGMFVGTVVLSFFPLVFKFWRKPQWRMGAAPQAAAAPGGA